MGKVNYLLDTKIVSAVVNRNQKIIDKLLDVDSEKKMFTLAALSFMK